MKLFNKLNLSILVLAVALFSCENDDNGSVEQESKIENAGYTLSLKTTGGNETEFIISTGDLMTGEISAEGNGIELETWRFFYPVGETLFTTGYSEDNACLSFADNGQNMISEKTRFIFDNSLEMFGVSEDEQTFLAMITPRTGYTDAELHFVNVETGLVEDIKTTEIYEKRHTGDDAIEGEVAWPTALVVRGDKLFIPYQVLDGKGFFTTPDADKAYIAVYPYPNLGAAPEKIIEDDRTSNIGVNGGTTGLISTDSGDLYSYSCGAEMAGFSPAATNPSGILRIKSGETEFDDSYFFNIEETTGGGKLFWFDYVGDGKAIGRILTSDDGGAWAAYGRDVFNQKLVIIDLENQTITDVENVPLHAKRYSSPVFVEDGKAYVSIETATEVYIYQVNIATAVGVQGAKVVGKTIKGIYKL